MFIIVVGQPIKIEFNRFIPNRPNLIKFHLEPVATVKNPFIQDFDCEWLQYINDVSIWCYNEDYPKVIEIDMRLVTPRHSYKLSMI